MLQGMLSKKAGREFARWVYESKPIFVIKTKEDLDSLILLLNEKLPEVSWEYKIGDFDYPISLEIYTKERISEFSEYQLEKCPYYRIRIVKDYSIHYYSMANLKKHNYNAIITDISSIKREDSGEIVSSYKQKLLEGIDDD